MSDNLTGTPEGYISPVNEYIGNPKKPAKLAIIVGHFNDLITKRLLMGAMRALTDFGQDPKTPVYWVAGAFEFPVLAKQLIEDGIIEESIDAVVSLGCVIRGDTAHFDFVAGESARGLMDVSTTTGIPCIFGILTTDTVDQAMARCLPDKTNKGYEAIQTALEMADLSR